MDALSFIKDYAETVVSIQKCLRALQDCCLRLSVSRAQCDARKAQELIEEIRAQCYFLEDWLVFGPATFLSPVSHQSVAGERVGEFDWMHPPGVQ